MVRSLTVKCLLFMQPTFFNQLPEFRRAQFGACLPNSALFIPSGVIVRLAHIARTVTETISNRDDMKTKAIFYHAGCPVCVAAEQNVASALDPQRFELEEVHLGQEKRRVFEAERTGVKSVPALVLDNHAYHINFGASLDTLK